MTFSSLDEAKKATVHAEHVLHADVAPTAAAGDRVRVGEAGVAETRPYMKSSATHEQVTVG